MACTRFRTFLVLCVAIALAVMSSCKRNHPPDVPAVLAGPDSCFTDTTYALMATTTDIDGDSVQVRFDWGDSTFSDWKGWFPSGDTVALAHAWTDTGSHKVAAQARDQKLLASNWSSGLTIRAVHHRPSHAPDRPTEPTGPSIVGRETSCVFTTAVTDTYIIPVAVRFAWGDGDTSAWSAFVASGESVTMPHLWAVPDTYAIRAQAKDTSSVLSEWSYPCSVVVRPPDTLSKWRFRLATGYDMSLLSSPAIAPDGTIYIGSPDGALYALNPDGALKWRYPADVNDRSSPAIAPDGTVYIGSNDGHLYAINPSGALKWSHQFATADAVSSPSIALDGTVYCACGFDLYGVIPDSGGGLRVATLDSNTTASAAAISADGMVCLTDRAGGVHALYSDFVSKWAWSGTHGLDLTDLAVGGDGTIYFGCGQAYWYGLYAVEPVGQWIWGASPRCGVKSAPAVGPDGTIYFGATDHNLYAVNPDSTPKWRYATGGEVDAGPAIAADGTVYVGSNDDYLYAVNADGNLKWRYETGGKIEAASTIGTDGTIYFTSDDGYLYALKGSSPLASSPWPKFHHDLQNTGRVPGDARWTRMDTVGSPILAPDSSGFTIHVANAGNKDVTIGSLKTHYSTGFAWMRDFLADSVHGFGYPIPSGRRGTWSGDTIRFTPITVAPNRTQVVDLQFLDFHVDSLGADTTTKVVRELFRYQFEDGSSIQVQP
ncbi:MAG TPA: PQQ-binding-like beta-propeller repeat protein [bacterium]|nr:PQQ-binding-like beta-propeller repeat protein [bacterium]